MDNELGDRPVALVTGGNKGIGRETVRRLVDEGYRVYLGARDEALGSAAAQDTGAEFLQLDVTSEGSVSAAASVVGTTDGRLDLLVNNAGISGPLLDAREYTAEHATQVLLTNVVGYVRMMHAFLPLLEKSTNPCIVNVSSGLGSFGLFHDESRIESRFGSPLYAASKAGINMLTARYARLLPHVRINAADPGMTATDLSGGNGHSVTDGTDAILELVRGARAAETGTFSDRQGALPW